MVYPGPKGQKLWPDTRKTFLTPSRGFLLRDLWQPGTSVGFLWDIGRTRELVRNCEILGFSGFPNGRNTLLPKGTGETKIILSHQR